MEKKRKIDRPKTSHLLPCPSPSRSSKSSSMAANILVLYLVFLFKFVIHVTADISSFKPADEILISCGAKSLSTVPDGRIFKADHDAESYLKANDNVFVSTPSTDVLSPIYQSARIFAEDATYSFTFKSSGWHWIRLHFFAMNNTQFDLQNATFSITTDNYVLLRNFEVGKETDTPFLKEYIINATDAEFSLHFRPSKNSIAFINAIEIVSAPDVLISDQGTDLFPVGEHTGLSAYSYQVVHRINMGGSLVTAENDTLGRTWVPDKPYLRNTTMAKSVSISPSSIKYLAGISPLIAPAIIYASAKQLVDSQTRMQNFNATWNFEVDPQFSYMIRLHFCDIVSKSLNDLYFNVFVNLKMAISGLDLSSVRDELAAPYYKDIVIDKSLLLNGIVTVEIGPMVDDTGTRSAILNGLEVFKMSNSANSLDGEFGVDGKKMISSRTTMAAVGFVMMFGAFVGLGALVMKWHKKNFFFFFFHEGGSSISVGSQKTSNLHSSAHGLGRYFSFSELQDATKNFDAGSIIGTGGFGNVYLGIIDQETRVAVKRGNPQSEQGMTEFETEIQMLSRLRHRHLVSLIGYCDENKEMILVYEYMLNGPLKDHLYGKSLPPLTWKQRLDICIGAARGLHYLHTGTAQGIIHRDVKTTNILLDDAFVAKVADFGLSKDAPIGQGHVSTAVKGSFGYLDPEYFRRQQLTHKSDVYSFGVVLLEVLCARPALCPQLPREQVNLAEWAMQCKRKGSFKKIIDQLLVGTINQESMKKFVEAAGKCLAENGVDRPSMGDVLWNLEYALQLQEASSQCEVEDDDERSYAKVLLAPADHSSLSLSKSNNGATDVSVFDDQSGTVMFAQFSSLSGR